MKKDGIKDVTDEYMFKTLFVMMTFSASAMEKTGASNNQVSTETYNTVIIQPCAENMSLQWCYSISPVE
jgi:hypothetical protein